MGLFLDRVVQKKENHFTVNLNHLIFVLAFVRVLLEPTSISYCFFIPIMCIFGMVQIDDKIINYFLTYFFFLFLGKKVPTLRKV